jgi:NTE family protein
MGDKSSLKVGIALGSGAARGWAHIGVLRELAKTGIEPDIICGTSIGAFVGAAYASGHLEDLQDWVCKLTRRTIIKYMDLQVFAGGFITGVSQKKAIRNALGDPNMEDLGKQFATVATNLKTGTEVWLQQGNLLDAVHASLALPGLFSPVRLKDQWLVDGGLVNPVPVSLCRALGAEVVIAVNLNSDIVGRHLRRHETFTTEESRENEDDSDGGLNITGFLEQMKKNLFSDEESFINRLWTKQQEAPGVFDVLVSSINVMQDRITRSRLAGDPPDLLLAPKLSNLGLLEFDRADEAIKEGRDCVQRMKPAVDYLNKHL